MSNLLKLSRFMRYGLVNLSRSNATVAHEVSSTTDSAQVDQCKYDEWAAFLPGTKLTSKGFFRIKALDKLKQRVGLFRYHRWVLQTSAINLYISATDRVPTVYFLKHLELPNTVDSWFNITCLHVWMIMTRCNDFGDDGLYLGRRVAKVMWQDYDTRLSVLKFSGREPRNEANLSTGQGFFAMLFGLDEAILKDDRALAAALWRHVFIFKDVDFLILENLVRYTRVQLKHLKDYNEDYLLSKGNIVWKPYPSLIKEGELITKPIFK